MHSAMGDWIRHVVFWAVCLVLLVPNPSASLTLNEAVELARENLPVYKAAIQQLQSSRELHRASLSPYLPTLDASGIKERRDTAAQEIDLEDYDITLSYLLFDGGARRANRNIAGLNLDINIAELRRALLELLFSVKSAFYTAIAGEEILLQRKLQLEDAGKDYEIAEGRARLGVAMKSDVLQASVRLEQAKLNLVQAESDLEKAMSDLSSLIGRPLDSRYPVEGTLDLAIRPPPRERLAAISIERPEVKQAEAQVKISDNNVALARSTYFPALSAGASYAWLDREGISGIGADSSYEEKAVGVRATWNIFELGKFFRKRASEIDVEVFKHRLDEVKRQVLLEVYRAYEDLTTASKSLGIARQQLVAAEHNYAQALGEYRVGKGSILALVQAESALSTAREQMTTSRLNLLLSKVLLERVTGVESLEAVSSEE